MMLREFVGDEMTGVRIRNARHAAEMRLVDAADAASISPSLLSKIESGLRRPSPAVLDRLAESFGVPVRRLAGPDPSLASASGSLSWPAIEAVAASQDRQADIIGLADAALSTAMHETIPRLTGTSRTERYQACKVLAALASRPLETLSQVSENDPDPVVREASGRLLATLSESYCRMTA